MEYNKDSNFLGNVLAGLVGGLLFYESQVGYEEIIKINNLQDNFWLKLIVPTIIAFGVFILFAISIKFFKKIIKPKKLID